jgi:hypothetical protein
MPQLYFYSCGQNYMFRSLNSHCEVCKHINLYKDYKTVKQLNFVRVIMPIDCMRFVIVYVYSPDCCRLMAETSSDDYACKIKLVGRYTASLCKYTEARRNIINKYIATVLSESPLLTACSTPEPI